MAFECSKPLNPSLVGGWLILHFLQSQLVLSWDHSWLPLKYSLELAHVNLSRSTIKLACIVREIAEHVGLHNVVKVNVQIVRQVSYHARWRVHHLLLTHSVQLLLLHFKHFKGLEPIDSAFGKGFSLHAQQLGSEGVGLKGVAGVTFLHQVILVHLPHYFIMVIHLVKVEPLIFFGLLRDCCKQLVLPGELAGFFPSQLLVVFEVIVVVVIASDGRHHGLVVLCLG